MSEPVVGVDLDERLVADRHGVAVLQRRWTAGAASGSVVIAHGASEHCGRYDRFARALAAAGWAVYSLDHRGHGQTAASTGPGRSGPCGGAALLDDLDELVDRAGAETPHAPVVLFGRSLGSILALACAARRPDVLSALVLCGFAASLDDLDAYRQGFEAAVLDRFGLQDYADARVAELSTDTRRALEVAAQYAASPGVLLLDEPTAGVAQRDAEAFGPLLRNLRDELGAAFSSSSTTCPS